MIYNNGEVLKVLEYNFTELDDDFITLWSNYLLYKDTSLIIEPLKEIAEKGQINAIQCWYLLKKADEESQIIDSIVDSYYGDSFNESLAIANRIHDKTRAELKELVEQIVHYHELGKRKYHIDLENGMTETEYRNYTNDYFDKRDALIKMYASTEYAKQLEKAAFLTEETCKSTKSCFVFERLVEIYKGNPLILNNDRISRSDHNYIRKALRKRIKEETDHSSALFSLGKSLSFFAKNEKEEMEGTQILFKLAKRPLKSCQYATNKSAGRK